MGQDISCQQPSEATVSDKQLDTVKFDQAGCGFNCQMLDSQMDTVKVNSAAIQANQLDSHGNAEDPVIIQTGRPSPNAVGTRRSGRRLERERQQRQRRTSSPSAEEGEVLVRNSSFVASAKTLSAALQSQTAAGQAIGVDREKQIKEDWERQVCAEVEQRQRRAMEEDQRVDDEERQRAEERQEALDFIKNLSSASMMEDSYRSILEKEEEDEEEEQDRGEEPAQDEHESARRSSSTDECSKTAGHISDVLDAATKDCTNAGTYQLTCDQHLQSFSEVSSKSASTAASGRVSPTHTAPLQRRAMLKWWPSLSRRSRQSRLAGA